MEIFPCPNRTINGVQTIIFFSTINHCNNPISTTTSKQKYSIAPLNCIVYSITSILVSIVVLQTREGEILFTFSSNMAAALLTFSSNSYLVWSRIFFAEWCNVWLLIRRLPRRFDLWSSLWVELPRFFD